MSWAARSARSRASCESPRRARSRPVGAPPERAEDVHPGCRYTRDLQDPVHVARLVEAVDRAQNSLRRRDEEANAGAAPAPAPAPRRAPPNAAPRARPVQVDSERDHGRAPRRARPPAGRRAREREGRPAEHDLGVGRPVLDPDRLGRGPGRLRRRLGAAALGHAWASATPKAGGSAVSRSVTVSGWKRPPIEKALTVISAPRNELLEEAGTASGRLERAARSPGEPRFVGHRRGEPALALPVGRLDDARRIDLGAPPRRSERAATAAAAPRPLRTTSAGGASTRRSPPSPARADGGAVGARDARRDRDGPVDSRARSAPQPASARARRSIPVSSSPKDRPPDRVAEARRARIAVAGDHQAAPLSPARGGGPAAPGRRLGRGGACRRRCSRPVPTTPDSRVPGDGALEARLERGRAASRVAARPSRSTRRVGRPGPAARRRGP